MPIEEGQAAPAFKLNNQHGDPVTLKDHLGQHVILYFYPKDDTPGCTKEAAGFARLHADFGKLNAVVFGISPDDDTSHRQFIAKLKLPFSLLCDTDKEMMRTYGAFGEKMMYGKKRIGVIRSTVWVGPNGKVIKHWRRVPKAESHPDKVLDRLQEHAAS